MAFMLQSPILLAQEEELPTPVPDIPLSGTLPVCYVNTENGAPIVSKEDYINANIWIDPMGIEGIEAFGSEESPIVTEIRGRGNSSWTGYGKKPYKIKLAKKNTPFGFPKSKHFALLAHAPTQAYFAGETAYELARLIGLGWVPRSHPVEVVLNGTNIGVYAFSESVRIDPGRVEIDEQPESNTDESTIPYGWLVEIDNSDDTPQILVPQTIEENPDAFVSRFTLKTPEVISQQQETWAKDQFTELTRLILSLDKNNAAWTDMIDIESLAKYYIVQELSGNYDAFVGSTYLHKGSGDKWIFGPIWDSEWTFVPEERFGHIWEERVSLTGVDRVNFTWIKELIKFPVFQEEVRRVWKEFYAGRFNNVYSFMDDFYNLTKAAYETNNLIWPSYISHGIHSTYNRLKTILPRYAEWFDKMIQDPDFSGIEDVETVFDSETAEEWYTLQGVRLYTRPSASGIYVLIQGTSVRKVHIRN
ncbi:CotH kinase family protein [uncultured Muribaculum sp.]|nr:CotH kinase family protein [uncultured Muribaculum sp.]